MLRSRVREVRHVLQCNQSIGRATRHLHRVPEVVHALQRADEAIEGAAAALNEWSMHA